MIVVDASVIAAALVDSGPDGTWAEQVLARNDLAAPHLVPVEVASILRRAMLHGDISADTAALAHADLLDLRIDLVPYGPFAERVWELRDNVTPCDAWYVALAELLETSVATLDERLASAPGVRCMFVTPRA
jgi:predicted nucleic acid-binding protein